jgi:hypothetical protein
MVQGLADFFTIEGGLFTNKQGAGFPGWMAL